MPLPYGPNVRVLCRPSASPGTNFPVLCVQVRRVPTPRAPQPWATLYRYSTAAPDAFERAAAQARRVRRALLEGENPQPTEDHPQ